MAGGLIDDIDLTLPDDASRRVRFPPPVIERSPSRLITEARDAYEAGLFIACLTILVTVPDVCANLRASKEKSKYAQRDWCTDYLGLPPDPVCTDIDRSSDQTPQKIAGTLKQLERSGNFTASDFAQLRNAVLHTASSVIDGPGAKYSPFHSISVQVTDLSNQLVIGYGASSRPAGGDTETDCRFKLTISLTALLARMEDGVASFLEDFPELDKELGKWEVLNWGIVDLRTTND